MTQTQYKVYKNIKHCFYLLYKSSSQVANMNTEHKNSTQMLRF
jgi:hypothetical protein